MTKNENLIILKKSSLKRLIGKFFKIIIKGYITLNKETTLFWRRLFSSESRIRILLESEALVLFFNTVLFAFVGRFLGGVASQLLLVLAFLNIMAFLIIKMEWVVKLLKK